MYLDLGLVRQPNEAPIAFVPPVSIEDRPLLLMVVSITHSVLHHKSFIKTCHEHHIYVLMHVIKCVDQFL